MDKVVTIYDAKTNLSKLVKQAEAGKTIYIGAFGKPQAVIAPVPKKKPIKFGLWEGKYSTDFLDEDDTMQTDPEILDMMLNGKIMPDGEY
jgi:antitoxin (DNA-binding transcriptional repressor) of toxin-antitoxin stability system